MSGRDGWCEVKPDRPCAVCRKGDWCATSADGWTRCERAREAPAGMVLIKPVGAAGGLFRPVGNSSGRLHTRPRAAPTLAPSAVDWASEAQRFTSALTPDQLTALAADLGVTAGALEALGVGWASGDDLLRMRASGADWKESYPDGAYSFPERDGGGRAVGLSLRAVDGRKGSPSGKLGAKRGLIIPATLRDRPDPVLIVEGASDTAALECLGLSAVGRPSNSGGAYDLARLLRGRAVLVMGERDQKPDGSWPGRDGAAAVAQRLATTWGEAVAWALPPEGVKDVRAWLQARVTAGLDLADPEACRAAGAELLAAFKSTATEEKPEQLSQAEKLVRLALELYRVGLADGDEPFAVAHDGPNIALMFRGSRDALRSALAREYRRKYGTTPNASALADCLTALQGEAHERSPEAVFLRLAEHGGGVVLDLGGADGRAVIVRPDGWEVVDVSPVLFKRTALTGTLPEPEAGGNLGELRGLLNVRDDSWPLVVGWLVAALLPGIPHPVLLLGGQQGAGKSTAARLLVELFDPSPALLRSQPREPEAWALAAAGSWCVCIDNVGGISGWWSDALCRCVTGDGWIRRRLYTDGELSVVSFRRVVVLTSIDAGALRGDLGDRLLLVDLDPIDDAERRTEAEIDAAYNTMRPALLGALLDLLAAVLAKLPSIGPAPCRMADFGAVLTAVDQVCGTDALGLYLTQRGRIAGDVLEADPVGVAVVGLVDAGPWSGTASELAARIRPERPGPDWPKSARGLVGRLRRLIPALASGGVAVGFERAGDRKRRRIIRLERGGNLSSEPSAPSATGPEAVQRGQKPWSVADDAPDDGPAVDSVSSDATPPFEAENTALDDADDADDDLPLPSADPPAAPDGWTADRWAWNLRRMAGACEALRPDLAGDYRRQADRLDPPAADPPDTSDADERRAIMEVEAEAEAAATGCPVGEAVPVSCYEGIAESA
ncbi:MAG: hypothetical protein V2A79_19585 [Planctomycetota bacterium]